MPLTDEKKKNDSKVEAMDGMLRMMPYLQYRIRAVEREIEELDIELSTGCVRSIDLTDTYKDQNICNDARHARLIMQKTELESKRRTLENYRRLIDEMIAKLSEEHRGLIKLRYEKRLSFEAIAIKTYRSRDSVRRDLATALEQLGTLLARKL